MRKDLPHSGTTAVISHVFTLIELLVEAANTSPCFSGIIYT